jgi:hypothetical protein
LDMGTPVQESSYSCVLTGFDGQVLGLNARPMVIGAAVPSLARTERAWHRVRNTGI